MKNYNYNGGKTSHQVNAIKLFKTWFDCDGVCQFKYRCNRKQIILLNILFILILTGYHL